MACLPPAISTPAKICIQEIVNHIPDTTIVCWQKTMPKRPIEYSCTDVFKGNIHIPYIQKIKDLFGTHLEVRIMNKEGSKCFSRFCIWQEKKYPNTVSIACPNDTQRNIDDLGNDLYSTQRRLHITKHKETALLFRTCQDHTFIECWGHVIPIEYMY